MPKLFSLISVLIIILSIAKCYNRDFLKTDIPQENSSAKAEALYNDFINGKEAAFYRDGQSITIADLTHNSTDISPGYYTLFDISDDNIPELFVKTVSGLTAISAKDGILSVLRSDVYTTLLNNGNLLYKREGGGPPHTYYKHIILNKDGSTVKETVYEDYHPENADEYFIDNKKVSEKEYSKQLDRVLKIGDDKIKWITLPTLNPTENVSYNDKYIDALSSMSTACKAFLKSYYKTNNYVNFLCYDLDGDGKDELLTVDDCVLTAHSESYGISLFNFTP